MIDEPYETFVEQLNSVMSAHNVVDWSTLCGQLQVWTVLESNYSDHSCTIATMESPQRAGVARIRTELVLVIAECRGEVWNSHEEIVLQDGLLTMVLSHFSFTDTELQKMFQPGHIEIRIPPRREFVSIAPFTGEFISIASFTGEFISIAPLTGEFISIASFTGECISIAPFTGEFISIAPLTGEFISIASFTGEFISIAPFTGEFISIASFTGEFISIAPFTGEFISIAPLTGEFISIASFTGVFISIASFTGEFISIAPFTWEFISIAPFTGEFLSIAPFTGEFKSIASFHRGIYINSSLHRGIYINSSFHGGIHINSSFHRGIRINSSLLQYLRLWSNRPQPGRYIKNLRNMTTMGSLIIYGVTQWHHLWRHADEQVTPRQTIRRGSDVISCWHKLWRHFRSKPFLALTSSQNRTRFWSGIHPMQVVCVNPCQDSVYLYFQSSVFTGRTFFCITY